jgi:23S rRNA (uracil1939-C5)-methyltransferase
LTAYHTGQELDLRIVKIVPKGLGLGFAEGLTVFVPLAAPGDLLLVRLVDVKKATASAEIVEVLEPGPDRTDPRCPYFGVCGGCDFQQLTYAAQLAAKSEIIRDCLTRIGKIDVNDIPMVASPRDYEYRSRARWHLDRDANAIGFYRRDSNDVVDISTCPISTPELNEALTTLRQTVTWSSLGERRIEADGAVADDGQPSFYSSGVELETAELTFSGAGEVYTYSAESFFQANQLLIDKLIELATDGASGALAFDLYSGMGLFTLPLSRRFKRVKAVEANPVSVGFARRNLENAGASNVELFESGVAKFLWDNIDADVDLLLLDPPRAGTEKFAIQNIVKLAPKAISYVSCEPSVLARDLRKLVDAGYVIDSITGVDLFPQTHHVEAVVRMSRSAR